MALNRKLYSYNRKSFLTALIGIISLAVIPQVYSGTIAQTPLFLTQIVRPLVMFAMSNDHQLYIKAYNDYSDVTGDGLLDTSYTDTYDYYGYFDSRKCYSYGSGYFTPSGNATGTNNHHCSGSWSGNFLNWATMTRMDILRKVLYGGYRSTDTTTQTILERILLPTDVHAFAKVYEGNDVASYTPYNEPKITLCNVTFATSGQTQSLSTTTYPPLLRVAKGGPWPQWAATEVTQCNWGSQPTNPVESNHKLTELNVRVEVCKSGSEEENCKKYPNGTAKKPTGLLQQYGEDGTLRFGLVSGSYTKNKSGGVLRRNVAKMAGNTAASDDEINSDTGQFTGNPGIIKTINTFRINKYDYGSHKYEDGCNSPGITSFSDGNCTNWGNPLSEIYLETLRYLAGAGSPTSVFSTDDSTVLSNLQSVTWADPIPADEWCVTCNVVVISTGSNSFDTDQLGSASDIAGLSASAVNSKTDTIGVQEGLSGSYLVGENGTVDNNQCTAKTLTSLSNAKGTCPEAPSLEGGYQIAGMAYHARTTDIRTDRKETQTVKTFGIALAKDLPRFTIPVSNGAVTFLPACEANSSGGAAHTSSGWRVCSLADLQVENISRNAGGAIISGSLLAQWEDSTWGNDYDMDGISRIAFCVGAACNDVSVSTGQIKITTSAQQANAGHALRFGFTITGSTNDGIYLPVLRPGGQNFSLLTTPQSNPGNAPAPVSLSFTSGASTGQLLQNPLWYAAKYGSFTDANGNNQPDQAIEWDSDSDGSPDAFFFADDPAKLGPTLAQFLGTAAVQTSSASVVANSVTLETGTHIYQARFDSGNWSGGLVSFPLNLNGSISVADWDAGVVINSQNYDSGREIITYDSSSGAGVPFRWNNLSTAQQDALKSDPVTGTLGTQTDGENRLNYIRGSNANELQQGGNFRDRLNTAGQPRRLGDIVNSTPYFVSAPPFHYPDTLESGAYSGFVSTYKNRDAMLYVGANDGMLHGFAVANGEEKIAYVPRAVFSELNQLTALDYSHRYYVDGSPTVGDAFFGGAWHTVLLGGLGAGGKGIFALDVTNPTNFDESNAGSLVLWDITSHDSDFLELGYTFSQPSIVKLPGGQWAAVFGNGYGSASGKAILYIVNIADGSLIAAVDTGEGPNNGLSTPAPVDVNGDHIIDYIYAGDLLGNLWRFEKQGASWTVSFKQGTTPKPLFDATDGTNPQPITTRPEVGKHPKYGYLVYFGTGKYFETGDNNPGGSTIHTFYGIWDKDNGSFGSARNTLLEQEVMATTNAFGFELRAVSNNAIDWTQHNGWYLDLPTTNEMQVTDSQLRGDRIIFTTLIPSSASCDYGGNSWLMELDAFDGGRLSDPIFDLNDDDKFNTQDEVTFTLDSGNESLPPSGKQSKVGIIQEPTIISAGTLEYKYASGSSEAQIEVTKENPGALAGGRQSWLQLQ